MAPQEEFLSSHKLVDDDTLIGSSCFGRDSRSDLSSITSSIDSSSDDEHQRTATERFRYRVKGIKRVVKKLMERHGGSTRHPRVSKMIHKLEKLNPTHQPAKSSLLVGDFIAHSSPDFPGRIRRRAKGGSGDEDDEVVQYTLGRLSFGIFQPHSLVCTVRSVRNSIQVCEDSLLLAECRERENADIDIFHYPIIIDLTIHTPCGADLDAEMRHEAICYELPHNQRRLGVTFLGGSLMPSHSVSNNPELLAIWKDTFANAYTTAEEERSYMGRVVMLLMKWWLKLSTPTDEDAENSEEHIVRYEMKRRPKGHMDVLYLDEDLRVTRGNRGTVIVVERLPYDSTTTGTPASSPKAQANEQVPPVITNCNSAA